VVVTLGGCDCGGDTRGLWSGDSPSQVLATDVIYDDAFGTACVVG